MSGHTLEMTGMTCDACARHVTQALLTVPGVQSAEVSYPQSTAHVTADGVVDAIALTAAVAAAGYPASRSCGARRASETARRFSWCWPPAASAKYHSIVA